MEIRKSKVIYLFVILAAILTVYFWNVVDGRDPLDPLSFDKHISAFITGIFTDFSYPFFKFMNWLGSKIGVGIVCLVFIIWLWFKKRNYLAMSVLVFAVVIGNELNMWLKDIVQRPRPDLEHLVTIKSLSFPSGHAMNGIILYTLIAYFIISELNSRGVKWITGLLAGIWILLMGVSRIVMQVHYPSDVAAGYCIGFIWAFLWIAIYKMGKEKLDNK